MLKKKKKKLEICYAQKYCQLKIRVNIFAQACQSGNTQIMNLK